MSTPSISFKRTSPASAAADTTPTDASPTASTPATPPTPATSGTASDKDAAPATPTGPSVATHKRRRAIATVVIVAVVAGALYQTNKPSSSTVASPAQSAATSPSGTDEITAILTAGQQWQASHTTFTGFTVNPAPGVLVGAAGPGMVVSVTSNGVCQYSGILPSGTKPILVDPTGSACSAAAINQATAALQASVTATVANNQAALDDAANQVAAAVTRYASANTASGAPSLTGLAPNFGVTGATVTSVSPDGSTATVQITSGTSCEVVVFTTTGSASTPTSC